MAPSKVWQFFKRTESNKSAKCLICDFELMTNGSTSPLRTHYNAWHKKEKHTLKSTRKRVNILRVACKICVHLFSCTCYDYTIKNNMCKHIHAVKINDDQEDQIDIQTICINNPMENDEICMKMSSVQQITGPSTESIANKIQQLYSMFVSQGSKLNDEQLKKINSSLDTNLKILYEQESNVTITLNENREPANKNVEKQLRFFSTKKLKLKIPEEQRLNKPTLNVRQQIIDDLNGKEESPYVHIDPHFDHAYEQ
ncbi:hypothetical protein ACI65C_013267 [Semiaphis heraclei]